jgi:lipopolysaccharide/colanic/teichoic acid biosynthesis glycosyltransferase
MGYKIINSDEIIKNFVPRKRSTFEAAIIRESNFAVLKYISEHLDLNNINKILLTSTHDIYSKQTSRHVKVLTQNNNVRSIVDFKKVNGTRHINKYFETINSLLPDAGIYIGCVESNRQRNERVHGKKNKFIKKPIILAEFFFHRVLPKLGFFKKIYFGITKGKYRYLSTAETLGRLVSCGFEIIEFKKIRGLTYFVTMKTREPYFAETPTYGPIVKLNRVGKKGKMIKVYKFRTMHPYAEYIQDFVLSLNGYSPIGKPAEDFRLTAWGKFFRKYWLDEVPQLINVFKGEMKLVGIRPLSLRFLEEYPEDVKEQRMKHKPGCVPPYVALLKQDVEQYIESEKIYMNEKEKHPYTTDIKYFSKAVYNIVTNKIRSS